MNALEAKQLNDEWLRASGILVNDFLPKIEEPGDLKPRSAQEVARRAWVLSNIVVVGYGRSGKETHEWLKTIGLAEYLTPKELAFLQQKNHSDNDKAWAAWHAAAVLGCAWSLGLVDLDPLGECPNSLASLFSPLANPEEPIKKARLRDANEIYLQADLHFRLHWAAREARMTGTAFPLYEFDVQLRRHSLDWVAGLPYEWDDIPSDT